MNCFIFLVQTTFLKSLEETRIDLAYFFREYILKQS